MSDLAITTLISSLQQRISAAEQRNTELESRVDQLTIQEAANKTAIELLTKKQESLTQAKDKLNVALQATELRLLQVGQTLQAQKEQIAGLELQNSQNRQKLADNETTLQQLEHNLSRACFESALFKVALLAETLMNRGWNHGLTSFNVWCLKINYGEFLKEKTLPIPPLECDDLDNRFKDLCTRMPQIIKSAPSTWNQNQKDFLSLINALHSRANETSVWEGKHYYEFTSGWVMQAYIQSCRHNFEQNPQQLQWCVDEKTGFPFVQIKNKNIL